MKKQRVNRAAKNSRKFISGSSAYNRRKETQYYQRQAEKRGMLHPRGLARSVAVSISRTQGQKANAIKSIWRAIIYRLPKNGQRYLYPERHIRSRKLEANKA